MATRYKSCISPWLCLFFMLFTGSLLIHLQLHLDPLDRVLGIAHGETLQTEHAVLYCFDNLDHSQQSRLQSTLPANHLVERRIGSGITRILAVGGLAFGLCFCFGSLLAVGGQEISCFRKRWRFRSLAWAVPVGAALMLSSLGISAIWTCLIFSLVIVSLSFNLARQKVRVAKLKRQLRWLRWVGLVWISQLGFGLLNGNHVWCQGATDTELLCLAVVGVVGGTWALRKCHTSRIQGSFLDVNDALNDWSSWRHWQMTLAVAFGFLASVAQPTKGILDGFQVMILPILGLWVCRALLTQLGRPIPERSWGVPGLFRIMALFWLPLLPVIISYSGFQVQESALLWSGILSWLVFTGRPWGSRVKSSRNSLDAGSDNELLTPTDFETVSLPGFCAAFLGILLPAFAFHHFSSVLTSSRQLTVGTDVLSFLSTSGRLSSTEIAVQDSWPEMFGALLLVFGSCLGLYMVVLWVNHQWDKELRNSLVGDGTTAVGALFGAYALGGHLGWHWADPMPFAAAFLAFSTTSLWVPMIPLRDRCPAALKPMNNQLPLEPVRCRWFAQALDLRVRVGTEALSLWRRENVGLKQRYEALTGHREPLLDLGLPAGEFRLEFGGEMIRNSNHLEEFANVFEATIERRADTLLTLDSTDAWLIAQSEIFPLAVNETRRQHTVATVRGVLRRLVSQGDLLEDPEAILDVLASNQGDEIRLAELCGKRLRRLP